MIEMMFLVPSVWPGILSRHILLEEEIISQLGATHPQPLQFSVGPTHVLSSFLGILKE